MTTLTIPHELRPADGRFGSGPAKILPEALTKLGSQHTLMGTSHRQAPIKNVVAHIQEMLLALYDAPDDYRVVLGNGGSTAFWDVACCSLITQRSSHGVFGEFGSKFAAASKAAPFVADPLVTEAPVGSATVAEQLDGADVVAWPHNETSTGACAPVARPDTDALVLIDATSAAGGMGVDLTQTDCYYFAPQKNFSSDGGLWLTYASPAAIERAERIAADRPGGRWIPETLNFAVAAKNSAKNQTYNTPALATLLLLESSLEWMQNLGGIDAVAARSKDSTDRLYRWADAHEKASPFVADPQFRSPVVATIDFDQSVDAATLAAALRANGIVDVEPYRSLNRNQIRVGCYASVDPDDVSALIACIDWLLERL